MSNFSRGDELSAKKLNKRISRRPRFSQCPVLTGVVEGYDGEYVVCSDIGRVKVGVQTPALGSEVYAIFDGVELVSIQPKVRTPPVPDPPKFRKPDVRCLPVDGPKIAVRDSFGHGIFKDNELLKYWWYTGPSVFPAGRFETPVLLRPWNELEEGFGDAWPTITLASELLPEGFRIFVSFVTAVGAVVVIRSDGSEVARFFSAFPHAVFPDRANLLVRDRGLDFITNSSLCEAVLTPEVPLWRTLGGRPFFVPSRVWLTPSDMDPFEVEELSMAGSPPSPDAEGPFHWVETPTQPFGLPVYPYITWKWRPLDDVMIHDVRVTLDHAQWAVGRKIVPMQSLTPYGGYLESEFNVVVPMTYRNNVGDWLEEVVIATNP